MKSSRTSDMTDAELIDGCKAGDRKAYNALFRQYSTFVQKIVYHLLGKDDGLEEIVQDVFIEIARSIHRFEGKSQLSTWVYRITYTVTMQHLRSRGYLKNQAVGYDHDQIDSFSGSPEHTAERVLLKRERIHHIYRAMEKLSERKKTIIVLHDIEGRTMLEISQKTGLPIGTVQSRLFHARRELRKQLEKAGISLGGEDL